MRLMRGNPKRFSAGSSIQLSKAIHDGNIVLLDTLTGSTVVLPPALGLGTIITVFESLAATSNSHVVKVQNSTDVVQGAAEVTISTGASASFPTVAASDTITLNRTTTGGATRGAWFQFVDIAPGLWSVQGSANGSGTLATPFSATV